MTNKDNLRKIISEYFVDYDDWLDVRIMLNPVWIALVSDGIEEQEVIDDDGRPNYGSSWTRLKSLVEDNGLCLRKFYLRWRKKRILAGENIPYFFFARCIEGDWLSKQNFNFFLTGAGDDHILVRKWAAPVLDEVVPATYRPLSEVKPEFIIWNKIGDFDGIRV